MKQTLSLCLMFAICASGCSPSAAHTPIEPSPSSAVSALTLSGPSFMLLNRTVQFRATLALADGTQVQSEKVSWRSDTPETVEVDNRGRVTPKNAGSATIAAEKDGYASTFSFRVVPDYNDLWNGEYLVIRCPSGCVRRGPRPGDRRALSLELSQTDDRVVGTLTTFSPFLVRGRIDLDGTLRLDGAWDLKSGEYRDFPIYNWSTNVEAPSNDVMVGVFTFLAGEPVEARIELKKEPRLGLGKGGV